MKRKLRMPLKAVLISSCFVACLTLVHSPVSGHSLNSPPLLNASNVVRNQVEKRGDHRIGKGYR